MKKLFLFLFCFECLGISHAAVRYLALGDSYTIGEGVRSPERWPNLLATELRARHRGLSDPIIIARTGWTTDELAAGIDEQKPKGPFGLVTLMIGVNNQYRGLSLVEYREQFKSLLKQSIKFAGGRASRVIVLSIPDWGVTPFGKHSQQFDISDEIDKFNAANREETQKAGALYVDITVETRADANDPEMYAADGLHPSGKMYKAWVDLTLPVVLKTLK